MPSVVTLPNGNAMFFWADGSGGASDRSATGIRAQAYAIRTGP